MVAALSVFTAVTTGWAMRGSALAQVAGPLPSAWQAAHAEANAVPTRPAAQRSSPSHQMPTAHAWMARERPQTWTRLSPQSDWSALPASFAPGEPVLGVPPGGTDPGAHTPSDRDILTQLCVDRR